MVSPTLSRCHTSSFAPSPVCPLHSVHSWCLRALPHDPSSSYCSSLEHGSLSGHRCSICRCHTPQMLQRWATVGRLSPSVCAKLPSSLGRSVAALDFPPLSRDRLNEVIGGGDTHRSLMLPSFSGSNLFRAPPQRPGSASERKETMTAWWLAVNR